MTLLFALVDRSPSSGGGWRLAQQQPRIPPRKLEQLPLCKPQPRQQKTCPSGQALVAS